MGRKSFAEELNNSAPYAHPDEIKFLQEFGKQFKYPQEVVMIGAGPAVMGVALLENHPDPPNFTVIDIASLWYAKTHLAAVGNLNRLFFLQETSYYIGINWQKSDLLDFLLIDGDHSFSGVSSDIHAWSPHVKIGGYIFFHDYLERPGGFNGVGDWQPGEVARAVKDHIGSNWKEIQRVGISILFQREA